MSYDEWRPSRWHQAGGPLHLRTAPGPAGVTDGRWPVAAVRSEADGVGGGGSIPPFVTAAPTVAGRLDLGVGRRTRAVWRLRTALGIGREASVLGGTKYVHSSRGRAVRAGEVWMQTVPTGHNLLHTLRSPTPNAASLDTSRPPGPCWTPTRGKRDATTSTGVERGDGGRRSARSHPAALKSGGANPAAPRVAGRQPRRAKSGGAPQLSDPGPWSQCLPRRHARAGSCPGTPAHVQTWRAQRPLPRTLGSNTYS